MSKSTEERIKEYELGILQYRSTQLDAPSMGEHHLQCAYALAAAMNTFTVVLAVGGAVLLAVLLFEMAAWRRLIWHIVQDAGVQESVEWREMVRSLVPKWIGR